MRNVEKYRDAAMIEVGLGENITTSMLQHCLGLRHARRFPFEGVAKEETSDALQGFKIPARGRTESKLPEEELMPCLLGSFLQHDDEALQFSACSWRC